MKTHGAAVTRRQFVRNTAAALAAPSIIPAKALGLEGVAAPSNRITMAVFGWGMQGPGNTGAFMNFADVQVVASCNIDSEHQERRSIDQRQVQATRTAKATRTSAR